MSSASLARSGGGRSRLRRAAAAASAAAVLTVTALLAPASAATRNVYVANLRSNNVSVIDPATGSVVATIPVGANPEGVAVSPDNSEAWTANDSSNTVSVIDTATNTVSTTIGVGRLPGPLAFAPNGAFAYLGHFISPGVGGVDVIDTASHTVVADVAVGNQPFGIAVSPDSTRVYVANFVGNSVSVIDAATNTVVATISSGSARTPASIALSPDGTHAYTANFNSNNVSVIDTATNTISTLIATGGGPGGVAVTPDGGRLFVPEENANVVAVIDTATDTVTATIPVGSVPISVLVDGTTAYVANGGGNTVSVIDTTTDTVTRTIAVGNTPFAIAQAPTPPLALPIVTGISPTHGPEAGGTTVTVSGSHLTGATQVLFGSVPASGVTVVNDSTLTATAPAQADGTVDVTVITPAGTSATDPTDRYTYDEPAPAVTGISPASGVLAGGTSVTITGTDFLGATSVAFGSTPAAFTVVSDTQITATAPASSTVGPVDVTVTTPAGTSATGAADRYTYSYPFTGFYAPVANTPTLNQVHAGQAIPMKFSLGGNYGLDIIPTGFPTATQVNCATGAPVNTSTLTDTAGGSGLQYDPTTNTYTYVWKTQKAWAGTCQVFTLGLNDTSSHVADFQFVD